MTERTKQILRTVAEKKGMTPEEVEQEMMQAIREAMASPDPRAQALWKQMCPDGKEPDLDTFLDFTAERLKMMEDQKKGNNSNKHFS